MPWPVYTERFLHHRAVGTWSWTVPQGRRAIVTNLDAQNNATAGAWILVTIGPIALVFKTFPAANDALHFTCKAVAYQGEVVQLIINGGPVDCYLDGSLLDDDTGATGPPVGAAQLPALPRPPFLDHIESP